jgi:hypothetical protein
VGDKGFYHEAAVQGILIRFWNEEEYEATPGKPFASLVPAGSPS